MCEGQCFKGGMLKLALCLRCTGIVSVKAEIAAAAAAAKSHQSCPTLWDPIDGSPPGSAWDSPGKNTGVGCHFLLQCMKVKNESEVVQLCPTLSDPWTAAYQAPLSMGFSRQEYWSGVPLPSPRQKLEGHKYSQMETRWKSIVCNSLMNIYLPSQARCLKTFFLLWFKLFGLGTCFLQRVPVTVHIMLIWESQPSLPRSTLRSAVTPVWHTRSRSGRFDHTHHHRSESIFTFFSI